MTTTEYSNGLIELVSPTAFVKPTVSQLRSRVNGISVLKKLSRSAMNLRKPSTKPVLPETSRYMDSRIILANNLILELAVKTCKDRLYITFSEELPEALVRTLVPELYNTVWDMCMDMEKIELKCVILTPGINGLRSKVGFLLLRETN